MRFVKTLPSPAAARKCRPRCEKTLPRTAGARKYSMPRHAMLNLAGTAALCAGPAALCAGRAPLSAAACGSRASELREAQSQAQIVRSRRHQVLRLRDVGAVDDRHTQEQVDACRVPAGAEVVF